MSKQFGILVGDYLKTQRIRKGMRQKEVADKMKVTIPAISYWENGKRSKGTKKDSE